MKRATLLPLLILLVLTGCNIPGATATAQPTISVDEVATAVAEQLASQPPTLTTAPTLALPMLTPTPPAPTAPATITPAPASPTPLISTTVSPEDPRASLGDPSWRNPFDDGRSFGLNEPYQDDNTRFAVENGKLVMTGRQSNGWHGWRLTSPQAGNFYLEAAMHTRDCSGSDLYGLVVRAPDFESGKGYYFGVSCDGRYTFGRWINNGVADVVSLTQHTAVNSGGNQDNRLGISASGSTLKLYANGKLLQEVQDTTFEQPGYFGVWVAANRTAGFTVEVDELARWDFR